MSVKKIDPERGNAKGPANAQPELEPEAALLRRERTLLASAGPAGPLPELAPGAAFGVSAVNLK